MVLNIQCHQGIYCWGIWRLYALITISINANVVWTIIIFVFVKEQEERTLHNHFGTEFLTVQQLLGLFEPSGEDISVSVSLLLNIFKIFFLSVLIIKSIALNSYLIS